MNKFKVAIAAAALAVTMPFAASASQDTPGTPGDANCHGQTIAYLAQAYGLFDINGIGNLAKAISWSVKDVQAYVDGYCG